MYQAYITRIKNLRKHPNAIFWSIKCNLFTEKFIY